MCSFARLKFNARAGVVVFLWRNNIELIARLCFNRPGCCGTAIGSAYAVQSEVNIELSFTVCIFVVLTCSTKLADGVGAHAAALVRVNGFPFVVPVFLTGHLWQAVVTRDD